MSREITVVIPTIPQRKVMLSRAMRSVMAQTLPARAVIVQADNDKEGSAVTRNRALEAVRTPWVAFLDDDDQFLRSEEHTSELQSLMRISSAVFCSKKKHNNNRGTSH